MMAANSRKSNPASVPKAEVAKGVATDASECGYDYFDVEWPAETAPNGGNSAIQQLYFHLHYAMTEVRSLTTRVTALEKELTTAQASNADLNGMLGRACQKATRLESELHAYMDENSRMRDAMAIIRRATKLANA